VPAGLFRARGASTSIKIPLAASNRAYVSAADWPGPLQLLSGAHHRPCRRQIKDLKSKTLEVRKEQNR